MKKILLLVMLVFVAISTTAQTPAPEDYFIITHQPEWAEQATFIPTNPIYTYNYSVDWGDGTVTTGHTGDATHIYYSTNTFTVKITGVFPQYYNNGRWNTFLKTVEQWGTIQWKSMKSSFNNRHAPQINTIDNPDLSQVTDMSKMFYQTGDFNGDISGWNVSTVTNMSNMFFQAYSFNQDLSNWDVGNVKDMSYMFEKTAFNQDIGNWNVSNVTTMANMFSENVVFNQDLGRWNINKVTTMHNMFNANASALSVANYDALLTGWSSLALPNPLTFNEPTLKYCTSAAARTIILNKGWTIWDGGTSCSANCGGGITTYTGTWSNGVPTQTKKAIFAANYNTTAGSIDACSIQINPGFTLTVAPGTTIKIQRDLAINGDLIFESDATGNGELGILGTQASITGNATVQRFMTAKRSFRMVTSAVNTSSSIMDNWQEGVHNTGIPYENNQNPNPGFGTHITGSSTGARGFDATSTGNPSMFSVNVADQEFQMVANTDVNKLRAGTAFLMMVRGDRSINLTNNASFGQTILRAKGKLVWGKKHLKFVSPNSGAFVMVGNPYQSVVNMSNVLATSTNINKNYYYVYDPNIGANGAYVTVYLPAGNNNNGETFNVPPSAANQYLQPGQGAQLATLNPGIVNLDFLETDKAPGQFTQTNASGNTTLEDKIVMGQLYTQENFNIAGPVHDAFAIFFGEQNDNEITQADAVKPMNFSENLGIDHNGTYLSIEKRALPQVGETFPLYAAGYQTSEYVLKMEVNEMEDVAFYLEDHFTGTNTLLEQGSIAYSFSVDASNPESKATDRFSIRVGERLSIDQNELTSGISLYPNPMINQLTVGNQKNVQLENASIFDITGRLIKTIDLKEATSEVTLDVSNLSSATYMVVIKSENGQMSKLMVKE